MKSFTELPRSLAIAAALLLGLLLPAAAEAAPPAIAQTSFSAVSESSATLEAMVNPNGFKVKDAHFDYITRAAYLADGGSFGEGSVSTPAQAIASGEAPVALSAQITGLQPATAYVFRAFAQNTRTSESTTLGPEQTFYTLAGPPLYGACPNDAFRSGELAPPGAPSAALPDCRAYEQASPTDKDGGDVLGDPDFVKAAAAGGAITFGSAFGLPGGQGAQAFPFFLATRGGSSWSTQGLLPPAAAGQQGRFLRGWLPDMSETFATATRTETSPALEALYELHSNGAPATQITPYVEVEGEGDYGYAGASADGATVLFEAHAALPGQAAGGAALPGAVPAAPNVYAWDAASGQTHLASVMNSASETAEALPEGAFAGPYDFAHESPKAGGPGYPSSYYTVETHAVSDDGSVFFTAAGSGQLYERVNPTAPQSPMEGERCLDPAKACTLHLSASEKSPPDPSGATPAAFGYATADGSEAFFTSHEELTADANTGPVVAKATIGSAKLNGGEEPASEQDEALIATHALGMASSPDGKYLYWANPAKGTIGRANIEGAAPTEVDDAFIDTEETELELTPEFEPPLTLEAHSTPRYVAVDGGHVYWTNPGPLAPRSIGPPYFADSDKPVDGAGTIGRASLDASGAVIPDSVEPEFIAGASNPQGIAVDAGHVYWGNAAKDSNKAAIGRAALPSGGGVEQAFFKLLGSETPGGVAVDGSHVYFNATAGNGDGSVIRIPLGGGKEEFTGIGRVALRGIALDAGHVYWAAQGPKAVGRLALADFPGEGQNHGCSQISSCEPEFLKLGGAPLGLANTGSHLYFSLNGETPPNPGADLYRYRAGATPPLSDLTPDPSDANGAEVQGIVGATPEASYLYFVANASLDPAGGSAAGDCRGYVHPGSCSLYLRHGGQTAFVARLRESQGPDSDGGDWVPTPLGTLNSSSSGFAQKTAAVAADGTLLFRSLEALTPYQSHGLAELYRYDPAAAKIGCVSCNPSGAAPSSAPSVFNAEYPFAGPRAVASSTITRALADEGRRVFFQSTEALVGADTNGQGGCPAVGGATKPACQDVYEWEAPGAGSCSAGGPGYSPLNEGCIYLISTGKSPDPSFFADASESGEDAYFFTRERLVGQDEDPLQDVYDARVGGGLAAQNPRPPVPCEGEACKGPASAPPSFGAPPHFSGPGNPKPARCKKGKVQKKGRCVAGHHPHKHHHSHHRHNKPKAHARKGGRR